MIRAAITVGVLSILAGLGLLAYRHWDSIQGAVAPEGPRSGTTPPALPGSPSKVEPPPAAPVLEPRVTPVRAAEPVPERQVLGYRTHRVKEGDSLWMLSRFYYGSPDQVQRLAEANALASSNHLRVGQVLIIPDIKGVPFTPPDADHETTALPEHHTPIGNSSIPELIPPTLSHTLPKKP